MTGQTAPPCDHVNTYCAECRTRRRVTTTEPGKALVVRLEDGLPPWRVAGLFAAIRQHPGVQSVCDLSAISESTLNAILRQPEPEPVKRSRKGRAA